MIDLTNLVNQLIGFALGLFGAAFGIYLNNYLELQNKEAEHLKYRKTLWIIFEVCVQNYRIFMHASSPANSYQPWNFELWNHTQFEIAKEYPNEFTEFVTLLTKIQLAEDSLALTECQNNFELFSEKILKNKVSNNYTAHTT